MFGHELIFKYIDTTRVKKMINDYREYRNLIKGGKKLTGKIFESKVKERRFSKF